MNVNRNGLLENFTQTIVHFLSFVVLRFGQNCPHFCHQNFYFNNIWQSMPVILLFLLWCDKFLNCSHSIGDQVCEKYINWNIYRYFQDWKLLHLSAYELRNSIRNFILLKVVRMAGILCFWTSYFMH